MTQEQQTAARFDLRDLLGEAVARVKIANAEGDSILSAWLIDAEQALDEQPAPAIVEALRDVMTAFTEHLVQEAHDKGATVEALCPCWTTERAAAVAALKAAGVYV